MKTNKWKVRLSAVWLGIVLGYFLSLFRVSVTIAGWFVLGKFMIAIVLIGITLTALWITMERVFPSYDDDYGGGI